MTKKQKAFIKKHKAKIKTLTFAVLHFTVAFTVTYLLTGELLIASLVALIEPTINTFAYYFHELFWIRFVDKKTTAQALRKIKREIKTKPQLH